MIRTLLLLLLLTSWTMAQEISVRQNGFSACFGEDEPVPEVWKISDGQLKRGQSALPIEALNELKQAALASRDFDLIGELGVECPQGMEPSQFRRLVQEFAHNRFGMSTSVHYLEIRFVDGPGPPLEVRYGDENLSGGKTPYFYLPEMEVKCGQRRWYSRSPRLLRALRPFARVESIQRQLDSVSTWPASWKLYLPYLRARCQRLSWMDLDLLPIPVKTLIPLIPSEKGASVVFDETSLIDELRWWGDNDWQEACRTVQEARKAVARATWLGSLLEDTGVPLILWSPRYSTDYPSKEGLRGSTFRFVLDYESRGCSLLLDEQGRGYFYYPSGAVRDWLTKDRPDLGGCFNIFVSSDGQRAPETLPLDRSDLERDRDPAGNEKGTSHP